MSSKGKTLKHKLEELISTNKELIDTTSKMDEQITDLIRENNEIRERLSALEDLMDVFEDEEPAPEPENSVKTNLTGNSPISIMDKFNAIQDAKTRGDSL